MHRNLCALANNFADAGFMTLINAMIPSREKLNFFLDLLTPRQVLFVVLTPGIEVCQYRNTIRDPRERFDFYGYEALDADMKREFGDVGWWFDTAALTPDQTADRIVREASRRALVNWPVRPQTERVHSRRDLAHAGRSICALPRDSSEAMATLWPGVP
ncbi:hypothetical protein [Streptomyces niveus]|uniref:hypothetical protein n=1 Tax=Streptomyces niveus TaxID=193462 RepID=UPI003436FDCC